MEMSKVGEVYLQRIRMHAGQAGDSTGFIDIRALDMLILDLEQNHSMFTTADHVGFIRAFFEIAVRENPNLAAYYR